MSRPRGFLVPYNVDGNLDEESFRILMKKFYKDLQIKQRIENTERISLSEAYSSLKNSYMYMKLDNIGLREKVRELKEELKDYKERYTSLLKYLNSLDTE